MRALRFFVVSQAPLLRAVPAAASTFAVSVSVMAALGVALFAAAASSASPIGSGSPPCATCQGSSYDITYSGAAISTAGPTDTWRVTLTIDTAGYTGGGTHLDTVALKVSAALVSANLISAPGGTALWSQTVGGLNATGCSGAGSSFDCIEAASVGTSPAVPGGTYTWIFDLEIADGDLFTGVGQSSIKARYVNDYGSKVGALVSEAITLSVPEPSASILLGAVALLGLARRRAS